MNEPGEAGLLINKFDLHKAPEVDLAARRTQKQTGDSVSQSPQDRISNYLKRFHEITDSQDADFRERGLDSIKRILHRKHVVKPEDIPKSYWDLQRRILRERGEGGDLDMVRWEDVQRQQTEALIADQEASLDMWIDYLSSPDSAYSDELKYWTLRSVLGMSDYDKTLKTFPKRSKGTTKPFPDINREALAYVLDSVTKKYAGQAVEAADIDPKDFAAFQKFLTNDNFSKLYGWTIEHITPVTEEALARTDGEWRTYPQGSDHMPLVRSIQGHGTGWCTAGESTASTQLAGGDFHVYYTKDEQGKPTIPRIAIRMQGDKITEVRGVADQQNIDPYMGDVVQEKLKEFPDGKLYEQKVAGMKRLTEIDNRVRDGGELEASDLRFLYEVDGSIQQFGYKKDPRIKELLKGRDVRSDLVKVFNCAPEQISLTKDEALRGNVIYHHGSLDLGTLTSAEGLTLPQTLGGYLDLGGLTSAEGLTLPQTLGGFLDLRALTSAEGLTLPQTVGGSLDLGGLTSAEGLTLPQTVGGSLDLGGLTSAEGLTLPQTLGGYLDLRALTSAEGLTLPQTLGGYLDLRALTSAEGLTLPQTVGGYLHLRGLEAIYNLNLTEVKVDHIYLSANLPESNRSYLRSKFPKLTFEYL